MWEVFEPHKPSSKLQALGEERLKKGEVAVLLLAGGQGTRLGSQYLSKGLYPIGSFSHKTLFALFAEKVKAASFKWGCSLQAAIMTSPLNDKAIRDHFEENDYFGLSQEQISFFPQPLMPFLDINGKELSEKGPCGNGVAIYELFASDIGRKWRASGVRYFTTILIDNPLADPFSSELIGFHAEGDLSALVTQRRDLREKVGIYVKDAGRVRVCEYMEFPEGEWPLHTTANLSQFCFSLDFAEQEHKKALPLHHIPKGGVIKREYFIIDFVERAACFKALDSSRTWTFAPLKNSVGNDSIESVKQALQKRDRLRWRELFLVDVENIFFELSPRFYYPDDELLARYKGQEPPNNSYIE
ncbi:MAG: UTP--glucose-1-phosphate uridylyltransferase [Chlamydiota bacterium]